MTTPIVILAALDETEASEEALRTAAILGQPLPGAELHLLHVVESSLPPSGIEAGLPPPVESLEHGRAFLDQAVLRARENFGGRIDQHLIVGAPAREILQLATDLQCDVIVVGSHRRNAIERWLLGAVSDAVVRKASCAVIVARKKDYRASTVPEIEPACPSCLAVQQETKRKQLWCAAHSHRGVHAKARLHYESPTGFAVGSQLIRPQER